MSLSKTINDIKSLKIQGATNVAIAAINALKKQATGKTKKQVLNNLKQAQKKLSASRPNEPYMRNALKYIIFSIKDLHDVNHMREVLKMTSDEFLTDIKRSKERIAKIGAKLIKNNMKVMTHCHSSTVMAIFKQAKKEKKKFEVYCTESRPLYQGRITARELIKAKIPTTMIVDSAVSTFLHSVDRVFVGCDVITKASDCINKIGTRNIALGAKRVNTPLFICTPLLKFDHETKYKETEGIEERDPKEIWNAPPKGLKIRNLAFDITPKELIKRYVTEKGVISPRGIPRIVSRKYPWIIR